MLLKKLDKGLLIVSIILFAIGLVMVFSASNVAAFMRYSYSPYKYALKHGIILFVGLIIFLIIIKFPTKSYGFLSSIGIVGIMVLLAVVLLYGKTTNNATSWISIGPVQFQPSEFLKIILIVWTAFFYDKNKNRLDNIVVCLTPPFVSGIASFLILLQPDLGTMIILALIAFFMFFLIPIKNSIKSKILFILVGCVFIAVIVLISAGKHLISERQLSRIDIKNPCSEEKFYTDGNQVCNAYIAVNNGGLFGKGLGESTQKYLYLPEAHTDFIFAIVVEELGLIVAIFIIFGFMYVLYRIIVIGNKSNSIKNRVICYTISFYVFMHIMVNLMGIFGLIPMTGVPLPFLSYGGTFTISLIISLSIVQRIAIENKKIEEKKSK